MSNPKGRPIGAVKRYLIDHPRETFSTDELAEVTGLDRQNVAAQLNYMARYHRGVRRDAETGRWQYYERDNVFNAVPATSLKRKAYDDLLDVYGAQANLHAMQEICRMRLVCNYIGALEL